MKKLVTLAAATLLAVSSLAFADDQAAAPAQNDVMQSLDGSKQVADASAAANAGNPAAMEDTTKATKHHAKKHKKHHHKKAATKTETPAATEAPAAAPAN